MKQTLAKELANKLDFQVENNANMLLSRNNNKVDYAKFVIKKQAKTKNLETKRKYLILQKRNKRLQKSIRNNKVTSQEQRCKRISNANKNSLNNVFVLKRLRSIIDLKSTNLNLYYDKNFKKFKNWIRNALNIFETSSLYFSSK